MTTNEEVFSFHCNACGKCCNSPPAMTVEELFHHQDRFIGCLTVRIVERPSAATRIPGTGEPLHPDDLAEWQDVVDATSFALPGALPPHLRIQLGTQGYEHPINDGCPARAPDGRCSIHDDRKPAMCRAVPLEPALPDGLQRVVLRRRMEEAGWMGAACISKGEPAVAGFVAMVEGRRVVQDDDRVALAARRQQMRDETARWGREVFALLAGELVQSVLRGTLQQRGYLVLSMVPALQMLVRLSAEQAATCDRYAERQVELIDRIVTRAVGCGDRAHRPFTAALRQFHAHYRSQLAAAIA